MKITDSNVTMIILMENLIFLIKLKEKHHIVTPNPDIRIYTDASLTCGHYGCNTHTYPDLSDNKSEIDHINVVKPNVIHIYVWTFVLTIITHT